MKNEQNKIDPEVKKAIWKIVIYAVSVLAALFGGNVAAKNGYRFIPKTNKEISISQVESSNFVVAECKEF